MLKPKQLSVDAEMTSQQLIQLNDIGTLYLIDFGLSSVSTKIEDKAVDIFVLKRAFLSTHPGSDALFEKVLERYQTKFAKGGQVMEKFRDVELRGRKRECFG